MTLIKSLQVCNSDFEDFLLSPSENRVWLSGHFDRITCTLVNSDSWRPLWKVFNSNIQCFFLLNTRLDASFLQIILSTHWHVSISLKNDQRSLHWSFFSEMEKCEIYLEQVGSSLGVRPLVKNHICQICVVHITNPRLFADHVQIQLCREILWGCKWPAIIETLQCSPDVNTSFKSLT